MTRPWLTVLIALCLTGNAYGLPAQITNSAALEVVGGPLAGKHSLNVADVGCLVSEANKERNKPKHTAGPRPGTRYTSGGHGTEGHKVGTGTVSLKDEGKRADVTLDLQPASGVTIKGTVTCTNILRR